MPVSSSRDKVKNMLCYLLAFVLLQKVSSILNHYLRLIFCAGNERTEENISTSSNRIFERIATLVREAISHSIGINVQGGIQNTGEKLHAFTATHTYARQLIGGLRILYS